MRKIRVAHVLYSFGTGGMEKGVTTLVRNASPKFDHIIIYLTQSGEMARLLPEDTNLIELNKVPGNSIRFLWQLSRKLKELNPDVVHTRNWAGTDGIIAAILAGFHCVIHCEHGFGGVNPAGNKLRCIWIHRLISRWVSEYICVSSPLKN